MAETTINDLPTEMVLEILGKLGLHEVVVKCSKTCVRWRQLISRFVLGPKILRLTRVNETFKREIEKDGWTKDCDNMFSFYKKFEYLSSECIF